MTVWHEIQASRLQKIEPLLYCHELLNRLTNLESTHGSTHMSTHGQKSFRHLSETFCDIDSKFLESTLESTQQNGLKTEVLLFSCYFDSWSLSRLKGRLTEFESTHRSTHSLILLCAGWYSPCAILSRSGGRLTTSPSQLMAWNIFKMCQNDL